MSSGTLYPVSGAVAPFYRSRSWLIAGLLLLALALLIALYLTLANSLSRVRHKLAQDEEQARQHSACLRLARPLDRQQCLVEIHARRVAAALAGESD